MTLVQPLRKSRDGAVCLSVVLLVACSPAAPSAGPTSAPAKPAGAQGAATNANFTQVVEAAKKEKLVVVTMPGANDEKIMASFSKAYPEIPVEHSGIRPSDFSPRLITEQKNGVYAWEEGFREPVPRNSRRLDVPVIDPDTYPDYANLRGSISHVDVSRRGVVEC